MSCWTKRSGCGLAQVADAGHGSFSDIAGLGDTKELLGDAKAGGPLTLGTPAGIVTVMHHD